MPASSPLSAARPRKWRRRLLYALACALLGLPASAWWLTRPVRAPAVMLADCMPADACIVVEGRGLARAWTRVRASKLCARLRTLPVTRRLVTLTGGDPAAVGRQWRAGAAAVDRALAFPWDIGAAGRILDGAVAVGLARPGGGEVLVLATPDNLTWSFCKIALALADTRLPDGRSYLVLEDKQGKPADRRAQAAGDTLYATLGAGGLLVAANSVERLRAGLRALEKSRATVGAGARQPPADGVYLGVSLRPNLREWLRAQIGAGFSFCDRVLARVSLDGDGGVEVEVRGDFSPGLCARLLREVDGIRAAREEGPRARIPDAPLPVAPRGQVVLRGVLRPEFAWHALSRRLWHRPARPRRGVSRPMTVLFWEWLHGGVIATADGRFALALGPGPRPQPEDVPPAPRLECAWGVVSPPGAARARFQRGLRRIVDYYRAAGGSELYERVRRETRLRNLPGDRGRVCLHPLFFNHLSPAWWFAPGYARFTSSAGTADWLRPAPGGEVALTKTKTGAGVRGRADKREVLADIRCEWDVTAELLGQVRDLVRDKVVNHGFVEEARQAGVMTAVDLVLDLVRSLPRGRGRLQVGAEPGRKRFPFVARMHLRLP